MSKLGLKLFVVMLIIGLGGLLIVSIIINYSIDLRFRDYLNLERKQRLEELATMLDERYSVQQDWQPLIELTHNFIRTNQIPVWLLAKDGSIIYNSSLMNHNVNGMMNMMRGRHNMNFNLNNLPIKNKERGSIILKVNKEVYGELIWQKLDVKNGEDKLYQYFRNKTNKAIIISGLVVALFTSIFSFFLSRKVSNPLIKMNQIASKVAQGDFDQKINVKGNDEIAELGQALNNMTNKLSHLEKIRKESTSDLAHELRTPVTTIKSYLEAISDGIMPANQAIIRDIIEETSRLTALIEQLKNLAEAEKKGVHLKLMPVNLSELLKRIIKNYKIQANKKNIDLKSQINENIIIQADKASIYQIFNNLINNAVKYTQYGGLISIKTEQQEEKIVIKICDNGPGIPQEDLPFIFERFYRAEKSRNRETGGTGIGLSITKELLKALQGKIEVESSEHGTIFQVTLPL